MKYNVKPKFSQSFRYRDFYRYYNKHKKNPAYVFKGVENAYSKLIIAINKKIAKALSEGHTFFLPHNLGRIELRKVKATSYIDKNNKLVIPKSVNWSATRKLWEEDEESRKKRTRVYFDAEWKYKLCYAGRKNYKNWRYVQYFPNRELAKTLYYNIGKTILDAPLVWKDQRHLKI